MKSFKKSAALGIAFAVASFSLTSPAFAWENPCEKAKEEVKTLVEDIARSEEALKGVKAFSEEATATVTAAVAEYAELMMKYEKFENGNSADRTHSKYNKEKLEAEIVEAQGKALEAEENEEKFAHNLKAFTFQLDELKTKLASAEKKCENIKNATDGLSYFLKDDSAIKKSESEEGKKDDTKSTSAKATQSGNEEGSSRS